MTKIKESIQDLEETKKAFMDLKVKLEEVKSIEETLRTQIEYKERIQVELENQIVSLGKKLQDKDIKQNFDKYTEILDQIISIQRPLCDKLGLGYNQNNPKMGPCSKITENEKRNFAELVREFAKKKGSEPLKEDMLQPRAFYLSKI